MIPLKVFEMRWKIVGLALVFLALLSVIAISIGFTGNQEKNMVTGTGTVTRVNLEGGFWGITGDNGEHYDPINLDSEFQKENLRVTFKLKLRPDLTSFHMWGKTVEILEIQKL